MFFYSSKWNITKILQKFYNYIKYTKYILTFKWKKIKYLKNGIKTSKIVKLHKKFKYVLSIFVKYNTRFFILNEGESDV